MEENNNKNGLSIAALVCGIIGLIFSWAIIGIVPAIIGLVLGIICIVKKRGIIGMAIAGLITSIIGILVFALIISLGVSIFNGVKQSLEEDSQIVSDFTLTEEDEEILEDSVEPDAEVPAADEPTTLEEPVVEEPAVVEPEATLGQTNALQSAKTYLEFTAFSYSGLISQLEFEGYTTEDATYAADNCGADWNEQAARCAQTYLDYSSFSRDGLIDQLEFEGFSAEQAEYGVTAVGY